MIKFKGLYEWKLTNADTGKIEQEGKQWNVVSDKMIEFFFMGINTASSRGGYINGMAILLSSSNTTLGVDYRVAGASNSFTILATGGIDSSTADFSALSKSCDHNFTPPGSPYTIRIIGVKIFSGSSDSFYQPNFVSFIELSTPVTQNTNQYLYVKYTIYISYLSGRGYNTPNNRYLEYGFNSCVFCDEMLALAGGYPSGNIVSQFHMCNYLPPENIDRMQRYVVPRYTSTGTELLNNFGNPYASTLSKTFSVSEIIGPIGPVIYQLSFSGLLGTYNYFNSSILGYSPSSNLTPSVSRVFVHPAGRETEYFSDPSYPASSQGSMSVIGTPDNKYTMIARVRITKTGDASDLVDEIVNYTSVDTGLDTFTVVQDIATGDKYRLTTTGTLPSPLLTGTDYYIINVDSTTIKWATTYANALANNAIALTTQGTGDHTIIRQNTGMYNLEIEPWHLNTFSIIQLSMAIDYDGYVMPQHLSSITNAPNNYAEGDYIANSNSVYRNEFFATSSASMLRGSVKNGNYIYSVQQSRKGLINNVCRWLFNSVETSVPLCKFGSGSTKVSTVLGTPTNMYIFTSGGIYEYTFATPTVSPVLLTISGLIDTNILDACQDPITGYFWTGHSTGLSRINMSTLTATQYIAGTGQALEGMSANEVYTSGGQLEAYNGRVLRGGYSYDSSLYNTRSVAWVLDDGVGYYRVASTSSCSTCCLRKGTNQVIWTESSVIRVYTITVSGKNIGTSTIDSTYSISSSAIYISSPVAAFTQINPDTFFVMYYSSSNMFIGYYKIGGTLVVESVTGLSNISSQSYGSGEGYSMGALRRCAIDLDGNGNYGYIWHNYLITTPNTFRNTFGWNGSAWVKDGGTSRNIPKTGTHTLLNGLSVAFNNATGSSWDQQFISTDHYTFLYGPFVIKDNLQTVQLKIRKYVCETAVVESYNAVVPASLPYEITIPEVSDPNFRDMDTVDFITYVYEGSNRYTDYIGSNLGCTFDQNLDVVLVNTNIATGTPIMFYHTSDNKDSMVRPLFANIIYYAINYNSTYIRVASSYLNAINGVYIDILNSPINIRFYTLSLATTYYKADSRGIFKFSSADAGKNVTLTYTYSKFTT